MSVSLAGPGQEWIAGLEQVQRCPVCDDPRREEELTGLQDLTFGAAGGAWALKRCLRCRVLYLDPRPDRSSIHLAYSRYYTHAMASVASPRAWLKKAIGNGYRNRIFGTHLSPSVPLGAFITRLFPATAARIQREDRGLGPARGAEKRVLDVGCGNGQFLQMAGQMGWRCFGVEMDPVAAGVARSNGAEILAADISELGANCEAFFDAITLSHVIEHVHDPVDTLIRCHRMLKPGGYLWLETPNADSVGYELYGRYWRGLEPPRHLVIFNSAALEMTLARAGFERIATLPPLDLAAPMFALSAAMRLGRIAEADATQLPRDVRARVEAAARQAGSVVAHNPSRSEFVNLIAYRPPSERGETWSMR